MTPGEHLLVLFSIILGLGLTELLSSLHDLLHPETRAKWHWLPAYWACSVFAPGATVDLDAFYMSRW